MNAVFATGRNEVQRTLRRRMAITYNDLFLDIRRELKQGGVIDTTLEARELTCFGVNKTREELTRDGRLYAPPELERRVRELTARHLAGEPVAYLIGEWEGYGLPQEISKEVLIPRPDSLGEARSLPEVLRGHDKTCFEIFAGRQLTMGAGFGVNKTREELTRDGPAPPELERRQLTARHLAGEPVAYLIGEWEFYGLPLDISKEVLIPGRIRSAGGSGALCAVLGQLPVLTCAPANKLYRPGTGFTGSSGPWYWASFPTGPCGSAGRTPAGTP